MVPDGSRIAFWSGHDGGGYFTMSALGGAPRRVAKGDRFYTYSAPRWSPDGDELAVVVAIDDTNFVEVISMTTRESRRIPLSGLRTSRMDLAWSPDGRFLAYVDGNRSVPDTQLWLLRLSDLESYPLTDGSTMVVSPTWVSKVDNLYFVSNRQGSMDLWRQRLDEAGAPVGDAEPITTGVGMRYAAFSPDGSSLAYSKGRTIANVWRVPILEDRLATWEDAEPMTTDQAFAEYFDVSADGERILLSSDRGGNMDLWMLPLGGGDMIQMSTDPAPDFSPRWSPDGERIAFYSRRTGNREIHVMPADGGPATRLTSRDDTGGGAFIATWSPDGSRLAFGLSAELESHIFVVPSSGGVAEQWTQSPADNWHPDWSQNGDVLAFESALAIWLVVPGESDAERLTQGAGGFPRWSPDGARVFFIGRNERVGNLWSVRIDGARRAPADRPVGPRRPARHAGSRHGRPLPLLPLGRRGGRHLGDGRQRVASAAALPLASPICVKPVEIVTHVSHLRRV